MMEAEVVPAIKNKFAHLPINTPVQVDGQTFYVGVGGNLYTTKRRDNAPTLPEKSGARKKPGDALKGMLSSLMAQKIRDPELYGIMTSDPEFFGVGVTREQLIAMQLVEKACQGDMGAIDRVYDRLYGKATQHIEEKKEVLLLSYAQFLQKLATEDKEEILELLE